jgi:hypothetical protein
MSIGLLRESPITIKTFPSSSTIYPQAQKQENLGAQVTIQDGDGILCAHEPTYPTSRFDCIGDSRA